MAARIPFAPRPPQFAPAEEEHPAGRTGWPAAAASSPATAGTSHPERRLRCTTRASAAMPAREALRAGTAVEMEHYSRHRGTPANLVRLREEHRARTACPSSSGDLRRCIFPATYVPAELRLCR